MRARDLAEPYPTIGLFDQLTAAADLLVSRQLPALLVLDAEGQPIGVLRAERLIAACLPRYFEQNPLLARVIDERHADRLSVSSVRPVSDCFPPGRPRPFSVGPDCTVVQVAELMARTGSPVVAVTAAAADGTARLVGAVTATRLLERLGQGTPA
ncbi:CBS domain-containing protein [Streptomyces canus]|uniref:CBS domain-containing protein n=1 Tax=Streptomyces canus TaxID=58343 RepID=UPI00224DD522|nr:CBS domain-containing protein [Streptomyces canus]MCX4862215.1 CBS domain-containing protein [Streptomyces canus]WSW32691.1 CBS domain-containing protein [Streptomyces canus]